MLTLEPPYYEIDGIIVYRDHAISNQFYYAAPPPAIARIGDRPMFDLMAYTVSLKHSVLGGTSIPDELGAGFLTMGVECALTNSHRGRILDALEDFTGLPKDLITLYPIPYHKGTVSVIALDQYVTPGETPATAGSATPLSKRPTFVEAVLGSGKPSLLGDLRGIFSLNLSEEGVAFLQGLYEDGAAPVGVVYDLKFYGLRPSVEARVTADLSRIYEHFGGGLEVGYSWFKADIQAALEYLETKGDVKVEVTSQATGEEAQKTKELALSLFRDRIIQELFHPTAPAASMPALAGSPAAAITSATGTGSVSANLVGLSLNYKKAEELGTFTYDFRERSPEERSHAPQGFMPALLSPSEIRDRIHLISLDNAFFELLEVLVTGPTKEEFDSLGIRQVEAVLTYGDPTDPSTESQTLLFRPDSTGDKVFAAKRQGRNTLAYNCQLTYEFSREPDSDADSFRYALPPRTCTGRSLLINPYADFGVLNVEVQPGRIHPDVREVDVHLSYVSEKSGFGANEHLRLNLNDARDMATRRVWQVRTLETELSPYTAACTFIFADGDSYAAPAQVCTDRLFRVDSPFKSDRELLIKPNPASPLVDQITVEMEYEDRNTGYLRRARAELQAPFTSFTQSWPILDPNQQTVRYRVTVHEPGLLSEGDWQETSDPSIIVGDVEHRVGKIQVRLIGPSLDSVGLDALLVRIALAQPVDPTAEPKIVLLEPGQASANVELTLPPGTALRYKYQTTAFRNDGTFAESEWREATSSILIIQTRTL